MHIFQLLQSWKNYPDDFKNNLIYNALLNLHITNKLQGDFPNYFRYQYRFDTLFEDLFFYFPVQFPMTTSLEVYTDFFLPEPNNLNSKEPIKTQKYIQQLTEKLKNSELVKEYLESTELERLYYLWKSEIFFSFYETHDVTCNLDLMENLQWIVIDNPTYYWIGDGEDIQSHLGRDILKNIKSNKKIKGLVLRGCSIGNVEFLKEFTGLAFLNLEGNTWHVRHATEPPFFRGLKDITALSELKSLEKLNISNTYVEDLSPLADVTTLKELICLNIPITLEHVNKIQKRIPNCKITHNAKPAKTEDEIDADNENRSSYKKYGGYNGFSDEAIDDAFEGDPENTWNVD